MSATHVLGLLSVVIGMVGYIPYVRGLWAGTYVPHPFSWSVFGLMTGIATYAQLSNGGGAGSWVMVLTTVACLLFACAGLGTSARRYIAPIDWFCLAGALAAVVVWLYADTPLTAVILITIVDAIAYAPMIRKAYSNPETESLLGGVLAAAKFIPAIFALDSFSFITVLYPASLIFTNALYVLAHRLGSRRCALEKK